MSLPLVVGHRDPAPRELVGGKASRLADLADLGLPVPRWVVVTTAAAEAALAPVRERIEGIVGALPTGDVAAARRAEEAIAGLVAGAPWPTEVEREVVERLRAFRADRALAVRSSAVGEDGAEHSYAGQLVTVLNVDRADVAAAVRRCWAGAYAQRALLYRQARGLTTAPVRIAVVVQELVESRVSGVAFTADPVTGAPLHFVVAAYGLGEGVVADLVESDRFTRAPGEEAWVRTVQRKTRRVVPRRDGAAGTEIVAVCDSEQERPALTPAQLDALAAVLNRVERETNVPQDVEWAFDRDGELHVLQARPIGTVPAGEIAIWDDSNIGESYPGLTLPLTYSFARLCYERVFSRALREAGVAQRTVARLRPELAHLIGVIRGRLYFNLANYYKLFGAVPGLGAAVPQWETALGITQHANLRNVRERPRWRGARSHLLAWRTGFQLLTLFARRARAVRRFHARIEQLVARYGEADLTARSPDELFRTYERIKEKYVDDWSLLVFNDLWVFLLNGRLERLCASLSPAPLGVPCALLAGLRSVESIAPVRSVLELVAAARREPAVLALVESDRAAEAVWAGLERCEAAAEFRAQAAAHLRHYGGRTMEELKFETRTPAGAPWLLVSLVRNYLALGLGRESVERRGWEAREAAERQLAALLRRRPLGRLYAGWLLDRTRRCIADRERLSSARARAYGALRRVFRALGMALARTGALAAPEDVFYLTVEDLEGYLRGGLLEADLGTVVERRRAAYAEFARQGLPHRIVCRGPVYPERILRGAAPPPRAPADSIRGVPCSPGRARGLARVLHAPSLEETVRGEIIVAATTEPGWAYLLVGAAGLVVERGSVLSHAAIIGRELGVPTVMGIENATAVIRTGDEVEIDGSVGEVRVVRRKPPPLTGS